MHHFAAAIVIGSKHMAEDGEAYTHFASNSSSPWPYNTICKSPLTATDWNKFIYWTCQKVISNNIKTNSINLMHTNFLIKMNVIFYFGPVPAPRMSACILSNFFSYWNSSNLWQWPMVIDAFRSRIYYMIIIATEQMQIFAGPKIRKLKILYGGWCDAYIRSINHQKSSITFEYITQCVSVLDTIPSSIHKKTIISYRISIRINDVTNEFHLFLFSISFLLKINYSAK